jgi:hypothetical protein
VSDPLTMGVLLVQKVTDNDGGSAAGEETVTITE